MLHKPSCTLMERPTFRMIKPAAIEALSKCMVFSCIAILHDMHRVAIYIAKWLFLVALNRRTCSLFVSNCLAKH